MNIEYDLRPIAKDITLCNQKFCPNKCKRYYTRWKPNIYQSYTMPSMGKKCEIRMD
jgi:hypothetical protein